MNERDYREQKFEACVIKQIVKYDHVVRECNMLVDKLDEEIEVKK